MIVGRIRQNAEARACKGIFAKMQKPAREQGRNIRLARYALANAQASASEFCIIFRHLFPKKSLQINTSEKGGNLL
jgi:hypothetical protein